MGIHVLDSGAEETDVQSLLSVSCNIFEIDPTHEPREAPADINEWMMRLAEKGGEIVFHRDDISNEATAFVFTFHRSLEINQLHIWIAGCRSDQRRKGIMNCLFQEVEKRASNRGIKSLTVNTYPDKFTSMPSFLNSRQYEVVSTTPGSDQPGDLGIKLGFVKNL